MEDCIFCKIIRAEIPCIKVFENDLVIAFMDIRPVTPGHLLVVPKKHAAIIPDLDNESLAEMISIAKDLDIAVRNSGIPCEAVNLQVADGKAAGQEVPHVHLHIIPRTTGDGFGLRMPADHTVPKDMSKIAELAVLIRAVNSDPPEAE
ncbi:MAG: HIT family protein [Bacteroidia bacterium]|nr:HIT family protein [Bacteroidia bacterium]